MKKRKPISQKTNTEKVFSCYDFVESVLNADLQNCPLLPYEDHLTNQIMAGIKDADTNNNNETNPISNIRSIITIIAAAMLTGVFFGFHLKDGFKDKFKKERNQKIEALRSNHFFAPPTSHDSDFNPFM